MRTYKSKTKRGAMHKETDMETAKEALAKALNLRKVSAKYSVNSGDEMR
jgi:hypothetical protein